LAGMFGSFLPISNLIQNDQLLLISDSFVSAYNTPQNNLTYTENFLYMLDRLSEENYKPNPKLARALDVLFILHAGKIYISS
jgi:citrate synthase